MPDLRPFRALRYSAAVDLSAVLAPPYDIISPAQRRELFATHPHNIVRIELPADLGAAGPADYAEAAATAAAWQEAGVLVRDAEPTVTVHEMRWTDRDGRERSAAGLLCRLGLEAYGPGAGVLPHEKTHGGPKADRYALLDATGINTSPIVLLAGSDAEATSAALLALTRRPPDAEAVTPDGVRHRLWIASAAEAEPVLALMRTAPLTIADGHHRYETALQHGRDRGGGAGTAPGFVLALVYPANGSPPALPTHRLVRGKPCGEDLLERLAAYAASERLPGRDALIDAMARPAPFADGASGTGRIGVFTGSEGIAAILSLDPERAGALLDPGLSAGSRGLDVNALGAILERAYGDDAAELAASGRLWYEKDASEAVAAAERQEASAAYLLDGMPPAAISAVAEAGEVMPQKSTYFEPKAPTGLVLDPLEPWPQQ